MKKLLLSLAALSLSCFLAYSQEAEGAGSYAELKLIPRIELNPFFTPGNTGDGSSGLTFGNSSFYTLFEGAFSEHVSFTLSNHWLALPHFNYAETVNLYTNTLHSNCNNWLDFLKFDFTFGNWVFTVGKDCLATGGFEYDDWDVDVDYLLAGSLDEEKALICSNLWYNLPCYQWGIKAGYNIGESDFVALQACTSPFGERPFASGLYAFSAKWDSSHGPWSSMISLSAIGAPEGRYSWLAAVSQRVEISDFTLGLDWYNTADIDYDDDDAPCGLVQGHTFRPSIAYAPLDCLDLRLQGNIYTLPDLKYTGMNLGLVCHYKPFEWLCVNGAAGWDHELGAVSAMAGVKFNLTVLSL